MAHQKQPSSFNSVTVLFIVAVVGSFYISWKYVPVYWEKQQIEAMMSSVLSSANRKDDGQLATALIGRLEVEFGILKPEDEDLEIWRDGDWVNAALYYPVEVPHPFGKTHEFELEAAVRQRVINW